MFAICMGQIKHSFNSDFGVDVTGPVSLARCHCLSALSRSWPWIAKSGLARANQVGAGPG